MTSASELISAAKANVEGLSPDQVAAELDGGDAVLVDLREGEELESGKIPDSIHIPRGVLEFKADPAAPGHHERLDPSKRVILHCASGGRSALGAKTLTDMGYTNVAHLDGGITAWREQGKPITDKDA